MSTLAFAVVIAVVLSAAAVALALWTLVRCSSLAVTVASSSASKLRAEVDALAADVEAHKHQTRSQFGKVWQRFAPPREPAADQPRDPNTTDWVTPGGRVNGDAAVDSDFEAMLALQRAGKVG